MLYGGRAKLGRNGVSGQVWGVKTVTQNTVPMKYYSSFSLGFSPPNHWKLMDSSGKEFYPTPKTGI